MTNQGAYGSRLGQAFGMSDTSALIMPRQEKPTEAVTEIRCPRNFGRTASIPREEAYLVGLQLQACENNDIYFNLLYGIVSRALQRGCMRLDLGQTPYWLKQCMGGREAPVYFYIRAERWYLHRLLKTFQFILFPELKLKPIHVFREQGQE